MLQCCGFHNTVVKPKLSPPAFTFFSILATGDQNTRESYVYLLVQPGETDSFKACQHFKWVAVSTGLDNVEACYGHRGIFKVIERRSCYMHSVCATGTMKDECSCIDYVV